MTEPCLIFHSVDELAEYWRRLSADHLAGNSPLMGLDPGSRTIGIAMSDLSRLIASPRLTISRTKFAKDAGQIAELVAQENAAAIIIGLPLNMDGTNGPRVQSVRAFARNLAGHVAVPICFQDERLSTAAVERLLISADTSRARRAQVVDKMAAAYILQGALDRLRRLAEPA